MTKDEFYGLPLGLYKIYWKRGGGVSFAAIGNNMNGDRWLACTNWVHISDDSKRINIVRLWIDIDKVEMIKANE